MALSSPTRYGTSVTSPCHHMVSVERHAHTGIVHFIGQRHTNACRVACLRHAPHAFPCGPHAGARELTIRIARSAGGRTVLSTSVSSFNSSLCSLLYHLSSSSQFKLPLNGFGNTIFLGGKDGGRKKAGLAERTCAATCFSSVSYLELPVDVSFRLAVAAFMVTHPTALGAFYRYYILAPPHILPTTPTLHAALRDASRWNATARGTWHTGMERSIPLRAYTSLANYGSRARTHIPPRYRWRRAPGTALPAPPYGTPRNTRYVHRRAGAWQAASPPPPRTLTSRCAACAPVVLNGGRGLFADMAVTTGRTTLPANRFHTAPTCLAQHFILYPFHKAAATAHPLPRTPHPHAAHYP